MLLFIHFIYYYLFYNTHANKINKFNSFTAALRQCTSVLKHGLNGLNVLLFLSNKVLHYSKGSLCQALSDRRIRNLYYISVNQLKYFSINTNPQNSRRTPAPNKLKTVRDSLNFHILPLPLPPSFFLPIYLILLQKQSSSQPQQFSNHFSIPRARPLYCSTARRANVFTEKLSIHFTQEESLEAVAGK